MRSTPRPHRTFRRLVAAAGAATVASAVAFAAPAAACGGLVGENGSIQLGRTTTLAAWHDGVEHYVTEFEFTGQGQSVGSIIPLPGVPDAVGPAGQWTLQRLQLEVRPPIEFAEAAGADTAAAAPAAEVLLTAQVDALDITVLRGGADEVGQWALENGFFLTPDAPEVLDFYAQRSPIFLAAKFDASRAAAQGLEAGQGTPISITIPTDRPWVPLHILGLGLDDAVPVEADVFLLTDDQPTLLSGGNGLTLERSEQASSSLMADLRSDTDTEWMPADMWLTHLVLDEQAGDLDYDLSASSAGQSPDPVAAGIGDTAAGTFLGTSPLGTPGRNDSWRNLAFAAVALGAVLLVFGGLAQARSAKR